MKKLRCNKCGHELDIWDMQEDFTIIMPSIKYGSKYDGHALHLHLCCKCMDKLIEKCKISPVADVYGLST